MFRRTQPIDLPIGLPLTSDIFDSVGRKTAMKGETLSTIWQREGFLSFGHWVWCGLGDPSETGAVPLDDLVLSELHPFDALSCIHSKLDLLMDSRERPFNWTEVLSDLAAELPSVWEKRESKFMCGLAIGLHPSHALLNCIASAFLADICAKEIGILLPNRISLIGAALTMNASLLHLQDRLSMEGRAPDEAERGKILRHPVESSLVLSAEGLSDNLWLTIVEQHHEDVSGHGYPTGLGEDILPEARILHFCDRFVAMISSRLRRNGLPIGEALDRLKNDGEIEVLCSNALERILGKHPAGRWYSTLDNDVYVFSLGRRSSLENEDGIPVRIVNGSPVMYSHDAISFPPESLSNDEIIDRNFYWPDGFWEMLRLACA